MSETPPSNNEKPTPTDSPKDSKNTPDSMATPSQKKEKMGVTAIIAAKNEEASIDRVIKRCLPFVDEVIVVDANSHDNTVKISEESGARVIQETKKGKGQALRDGAEAATHEIIVFIDADESHDPEDIPRMIAPIQKGEADHVTGSRLIGGSDELHGTFGEFFRLAGSAFITALINARYDVSISDSQNGFRAIRRDVFLALGTTEVITTIEQEMIMKTLKQGYTLTEVPAHEHARSFGESNIKLSKVALRYGISLIKGLL